MEFALTVNLALVSSIDPLDFANIIGAGFNIRV